MEIYIHAYLTRQKPAEPTIGRSKKSISNKNEKRNEKKKKKLRWKLGNVCVSLPAEYVYSIHSVQPARAAQHIRLTECVRDSRECASDVMLVFLCGSTRMLCAMRVHVYLPISVCIVSVCVVPCVSESRMCICLIVRV